MIKTKNIIIFSLILLGIIVLSIILIKHTHKKDNYSHIENEKRIFHKPPQMSVSTRKSRKPNFDHLKNIDITKLVKHEPKSTLTNFRLPHGVVKKYKLGSSESEDAKFDALIKESIIGKSFDLSSNKYNLEIPSTFEASSGTFVSIFKKRMKIFDTDTGDDKIIDDFRSSDNPFIEPATGNANMQVSNYDYCSNYNELVKTLCLRVDSTAGVSNGQVTAKATMGMVLGSTYTGTEDVQAYNFSVKQITNLLKFSNEMLDEEYLTTAFLTDAQELIIPTEVPDNPNNSVVQKQLTALSTPTKGINVHIDPASFASQKTFLSKYGSHVVIGVLYGQKVNIWDSIKKTSSVATNSLEIKGCAQLSLGGFNFCKPTGVAASKKSFTGVKYTGNLGAGNLGAMSQCLKGCNDDCFLDEPCVQECMDLQVKAGISCPEFNGGGTTPPPVGRDPATQNPVTDKTSICVTNCKRVLCIGPDANQACYNNCQTSCDNNNDVSGPKDPQGRPVIPDPTARPGGVPPATRNPGGGPPPKPPGPTQPPKKSTDSQGNCTDPKQICVGYEPGVAASGNTPAKSEIPGMCQTPGLPVKKVSGSVSACSSYTQTQMESARSLETHTKVFICGGQKGSEGGDDENAAYNAAVANLLTKGYKDISNPNAPGDMTDSDAISAVLGGLGQSVPIEYTFQPVWKILRDTVSSKCVTKQQDTDTGFSNFRINAPKAGCLAKIVDPDLYKSFVDGYKKWLIQVDPTWTAASGVQVLFPATTENIKPETFTPGTWQYLYPQDSTIPPSGGPNPKKCYSNSVSNIFNNGGVSINAVLCGKISQPRNKELKLYDFAYKQNTVNDGVQYIILLGVPFKQILQPTYSYCKLLQSSYDIEAAYSADIICPLKNYNASTTRYYQKLVKVPFSDVDQTPVGKGRMAYACFNEATGCQQQADCTGEGYKHYKYQTCDGNLSSDICSWQDGNCRNAVGGTLGCSTKDREEITFPQQSPLWYDPVADSILSNNRSGNMIYRTVEDRSENTPLYGNVINDPTEATLRKSFLNNQVSCVYRQSDVDTKMLPTGYSKGVGYGTIEGNRKYSIKVEGPGQCTNPFTQTSLDTTIADKLTHNLLPPRFVWDQRLQTNTL